MNPARLIPLILGGATAVAVVASFMLRGKRKSHEDRERERRLWLSAKGRIIDGTVTDVQELNQNGAGSIQLLFYQYDVAGVEYEASQDVTRLRQFIDVHSCRLGLPASIKYDPHNPGNSIVLAETWSGLRK